MPAHRKANVRQLTSAAYELDSGVIEGQLHRSAEDGRWMLDDVKLIASLEDERPIPQKVCRTCGTEYTGIECPRCREARIRLRGR
jgi:hypothetical protein